ncbi:MAG TPA: peptidylprolyl isomerase [Sphingomicrobium sp.]
MRSMLLITAALVLAGAAPAKKLTPTDVVNAAPASAWKAIPAEDLLVMDLRSGGRVVLQLAPEFAPVHVANIRALARGNYWHGATIYRVQDAYVVQWGLNESDRGFPAGVTAKPPAEYTRSLKGLAVTPLGHDDSYAPRAGFVDGWPVAYSPRRGWANLAHCYGSVGVGRDLSPDTGTGGELYTALNPLRHLDRNIAVVGRVIDGMANLSALPRGTEALGFYKDKAQYVPIASIRLASDMPAADRPAFEYLDTNSASFAQYLRIRANRHDDFYIRPAGGVDLCNVNVPVRKKG